MSLMLMPCTSKYSSNLFPVVVDGSASARYKSEIELNFRLAYWLLATADLRPRPILAV